MPRQKASNKHLYAQEMRMETFISGTRVLGSRSRAKVKWPVSHPQPEALALAGLYYEPNEENNDRTVCYMCGTAFDGWEEDDDPTHEHFKFSPDCALAKILHRPWEYDEEFDLENSEFNPHTEIMVNSRLETFEENWPHQNNKGWTCTSFNLSKAGLYFNPLGVNDDDASCAYCSVSLGGWEADDNPLEEHRRRKPNCRFFATEVVERHESVEPEPTGQSQSEMEVSDIEADEPVRRGRGRARKRTKAEISDEEEIEIVNTTTKATRRSSRSRSQSKSRKPAAKKAKTSKVGASKKTRLSVFDDDDKLADDEVNDDMELDLNPKSLKKATKRKSKLRTPVVSDEESEKEITIEPNEVEIVDDALDSPADHEPEVMEIETEEAEIEKEEAELDDVEAGSDAQDEEVVEDEMDSGAEAEIEIEDEVEAEELVDEPVEIDKVGESDQDETMKDAEHAAEEEVVSPHESEVEAEPVQQSEPSPEPKRRGRPPKSVNDNIKPDDSSTLTDSTVKADSTAKARIANNDDDSAKTIVADDDGIEQVVKSNKKHPLKKLSAKFSKKSNKPAVKRASGMTLLDMGSDEDDEEVDKRQSHISQMQISENWTKFDMSGESSPEIRQKTFALDTSDSEGEEIESVKELPEQEPIRKQESENEDFEPVELKEPITEQASDSESVIIEHKPIVETENLQEERENYYGSDNKENHTPQAALEPKIPISTATTTNILTTPPKQVRIQEPEMLLKYDLSDPDIILKLAESVSVEFDTNVLNMTVQELYKMIATKSHEAFAQAGEKMIQLVTDQGTRAIDGINNMAE